MGLISPSLPGPARVAIPPCHLRHTLTHTGSHMFTHTHIFESVQHLNMAACFSDRLNYSFMQTRNLLCHFRETFLSLLQWGCIFFFFFSCFYFRAACPLWFYHPWHSHTTGCEKGKVKRSGIVGSFHKPLSAEEIVPLKCVEGLSTEIETLCENTCLPRFFLFIGNYTYHIFIGCYTASDTQGNNLLSFYVILVNSILLIESWELKRAVKLTHCPSVGNFVGTFAKGFLRQPVKY